MLTYTSGGRVIHVLAWGAENASLPPPAAPTAKESPFRLFYDGGFGKEFADSPSAAAAMRTLRNLQGPNGSAKGDRRPQ